MERNGAREASGRGVFGMKILFVNQFFWPDTAATSQLLCDVTEQLSSAGDSVSVICGSASYGTTTGGPPPRVTVHRVKSSSFSRKVAGRVGSYVSFFCGAFLESFRGEAPDVIVTLTTPPLVSLLGLMVQKLRGARHIIWEMDVYPDIAIDLNVIHRDSIAARVFGWLADLPRHSADRIIVLGECMRSRLLKHGISADKLVVAENWAHCNQLAAQIRSEPPLIVADKLTILYSGNFGMAHDAHTISEAISTWETREDCRALQFIFSGSGSWYGWLKNQCQERRSPHVMFLPFCSRHELDARLVSGHIGLVTQKDECLGSAVPSKTYGIMAAGRPILFIGPKNSTPARIIEQHDCGWQIECGDVAGLVQLFERLLADPRLVAQAGARAYHAFTANYQRSLGVARVIAVLEGPKERVTQVVARSQTASS